MNRSSGRIVLLSGLAVLLSAGAADARAKPRCVHRGDVVVARSPQLVAVSHEQDGSTRYLVCRRATGRRAVLGTAGGYFRFALYGVGFVRLRGPFAFAALTTRPFVSGVSSELVRVDTRTWKRTAHALALAEGYDSQPISEVTALVPAAGGRAVVRIANDFAAAIVIAGDDRAVVVDEGLAANIGRPRVGGASVTWRRGLGLASSALVPADRCPPAPRPIDLRTSPAATADAVASDGWYCVLATGTVGRLDGAVVRLLGALAVVQGPSAVSVVDLRSQATINGPVACEPRRCSATVGRSGTLVLRRRGEYGDETQLVAVAVGMPERTLATGRITDVRYEDGLLRWFNQTPAPVSAVEQVP